MEKIVEELATCPICIDISADAVECDSCGNVFCDNCVKKLARIECPKCKKFNFFTRPSLFARRLINQLPATCPNDCKAELIREQVASHL